MKKTTLYSRIIPIVAELSTSPSAEVGQAVKRGAELVANRAKANAAPSNFQKGFARGGIRDSIKVREVSGEEMGRRQTTARRSGNDLGVDYGSVNDQITYAVEAGARAKPTGQSGVRIPYAHMVEYGTQVGDSGGGGQAPQPFLQPALEDSIDEIIGLVKNALGDL